MDVYENLKKAKFEFICPITKAKYVGQWVGNKKEGQGKQIWPNGSSYEGQWKDNLPNGYGIFIKENGDKLEG